MAKANLTIKKGKFYRDGKEEPPQFGNPEQIKLLKSLQLKANLWPKAVPIHFIDYEDSFERDSDDGLEPGLQLIGKCKCGGQIVSDIYEMGTTYDFTDGDDMKCISYKCREEYIVIYRDDLNEVKAILFETYHDAKNNN